MRIFWFYILIIVFRCNNIYSQSNEVDNRHIFISFQDFFTKDKLSLSINDCEIFKTENLTSSEVLGYTGITLEINNHDQVIVGKALLDINCQFNLKIENKISININGYTKTFVINSEKGIYVGFSKSENGLYLNQSKEPFEYD